jgi:hypothetical protein
MYDEHGAKRRQEQARAYLESVRAAHRHMKAKVEQAAMLLEDAEGVKSVEYDAIRVDGASNPDKLPDAVARIIEVRDEALQAARDFADMVEECNVSLASLGGWEADLLELHYICGMKLSEIAEREEWKNYDKDYLSVKHLKALEAYYDHMPFWRRDPIYPAI